MTMKKIADELGRRRAERRKKLRRKNDEIHKRFMEIDTRLARIAVIQHTIEEKITSIENMLAQIIAKVAEVRRAR